MLLLLLLVIQLTATAANSAKKYCKEEKAAASKSELTKTKKKKKKKFKFDRKGKHLLPWLLMFKLLRFHGVLDPCEKHWSADCRRRVCVCVLNWRWSNYLKRDTEGEHLELEAFWLACWLVSEIIKRADGCSRLGRCCSGCNLFFFLYLSLWFYFRCVLLLFLFQVRSEDLPLVLSKEHANLYQ